MHKVDDYASQHTLPGYMHKVGDYASQHTLPGYLSSSGLIWNQPAHGAYYGG